MHFDWIFDCTCTLLEFVFEITGDFLAICKHGSIFTFVSNTLNDNIFKFFSHLNSGRHCRFNCIVIDIHCQKFIAFTVTRTRFAHQMPRFVLFYTIFNFIAIYRFSPFLFELINYSYQQSFYKSCSWICSASSSSNSARTLFVRFSNVEGAKKSLAIIPFESSISRSSSFAPNNPPSSSSSSPEFKISKVSENIRFSKV